MNNSAQFDGNLSFNTIDDLRSAQGSDDGAMVLNAAQYYFQDDDFFLVKVTQALFEDFETKCANSENMDEPSDLVGIFYEVCGDGIRAIRKIALRPEKTAALASVLQQLVLEQQAYLLLLKLAKMEQMLDELKMLEQRSVLADLLLNDVEFRRLLVLLEWCEENAYSEPEANAELSNEFASFEKNCMLRVETLHARIRGERLCDLDLDGALHGRLHNKDEELQSRVYNVIYTLVRCGRIDEACGLLEKAGISALIPSLQLRQMSRSIALTPSSDDQSLYYLARSRAFLKRTVNKIISKGTSLSQVEACLWSVVAGRLEPALSLSSGTEDRLWCYLNAAVELRLDAAIANVHATRNDTVGGIENGENEDLRINSIFDEIATHERSPYYTIYRHLVNDDSLSLIADMDMWLEQHVDDLERFPHVVRFMAHLVLLLQFTGQPVQEESANSILQNYVRLLIALKFYTVVPYYASKLPQKVAEDMVVDFMYRIGDDSIRTDVLKAACAAKLDGVYLCKRIFNHAKLCCPIHEEPSESDDLLISAWNWLTYPGSDTYYEALIGMDEIMRDFFYLNKLEKAKIFLEKSRKMMDRIMESFSFVIEADNKVEANLLRAIAEYRAYECYLSGLNKFNEWFKQSRHSLRSGPSVTQTDDDDSAAFLDVQQRITLEVIHQRAKEQVQRYESASKQSTSAAMEALELVLRFPHGWMKFTEAERESLDKETVQKLRDIRSRYVTTVVVMLVTLFEQSDTNGPAQLAELLADEEYMLAEVIPKERLGVLLKQLAVNAYKSM